MIQRILMVMDSGEFHYFSELRNLETYTLVLYDGLLTPNAVGHYLQQNRHAFDLVATIGGDEAADLGYAGIRQTLDAVFFGPKILLDFGNQLTGSRWIRIPVGGVDFDRLLREAFAKLKPQ